jgi:hypothetical protein
MAENKVRDDSQPLTTFSLGMMGLVGLLRLLPHLLRIPSYWHVAPAGALSVYGGARLGFWTALALPLVMMAGTDVLIYVLVGWSPFDPWVYASLVVGVLIGRLLVNTKSPWRIAACTLLASAQFFLLTNFGTWLHDRSNDTPTGEAIQIVRGADGKLLDVKYANNVQGLGMCYVMGAKFSREDGAPLGFALPLVLSDLLFSGLMFGAYFGMSRWVGRPALALAKRPGVAS